MKNSHDIKYYKENEVVCTCGAYFKADYNPYTTRAPKSAVQKWANHIKETNNEHIPL